MTTIPRPQADEIAPHARVYVDRVPPGDDVVDSLAAQIKQTIALLESFGDKQAGEVAYAPGKWTVKEVIGHLSDAERVFSYRALRIARGDTTALPGFEQGDYVPAARSNERSLADLVEELSTVRQSTLTLVRSFSPAAWSNRATVNGHSVTVRGIVFTTAGHELHHYYLLRERYLPLI